MMDVDYIDMVNFMSHDQSRAVFPPSGVVVLTGANGSGKSSIIEAIACCFWGKTLRGPDPWAGEDGHVEVGLKAADIGEVQSIVARRARVGGKVSLTFSYVDGNGVLHADVYETMTKAQEALEELVGPFDVWRRSAAFSASDAAHFTLSTDAERKRLLEGILGIGRFDDALRGCRDDLKAAGLALMQAEGAEHNAAAQLGSEARRAAEAEAALENAGGVVVDVEAAVREANRLGAMLNKAAKDMSAVERSIQQEKQNGSANRATLAQIAKALDRIKADVCPTCNQKIPEKLRAELRKRSETEGAELAKVEASSAEAIAGFESQYEELGEELEVLRAKALAAIDVVTTAKSANRALFERILKESAEAAAEAEKKLAVYKQAREAQKVEVALLRAVERVLGTKGVRAHVLGRALSGLESVANAWLGRIAGAGLSLKVGAYTEKKGGGITDSISLEVHGAGGGHGYRGSSGGERRRLDVAILLALGEVASAAHGRAAGTLFCDEIFDTLDDEGIDAVTRVVHELSEDRVVLVIAHNEMLVTALAADEHWRVEDGRLVT